MFLPEASKVMLKIYYMAGREAASLVNEFREAGTYNVSFDASKLTAGKYTRCILCAIWYG